MKKHWTVYVLITGMSVAVLTLFVVHRYHNNAIPGPGQTIVDLHPESDLTNALTNTGGGVHNSQSPICENIRTPIYKLPPQERTLVQGLKGMFSSERRIARSYFIDRIAMVHHGVLSYCRTYGRLPQGDSKAICRQLMGDNPNHCVFVDTSKQKDGELLDPWGTPFRITVDVSGVVEVRSAGQNKKFGDDDDGYVIDKVVFPVK
jgi:hypothetical protein